jgi:hypothetical protein
VAGGGGGGGAGGGGTTGGGAPGGGAANACDGVAPALGQAVAVDLTTGSHAECSNATSDPSGRVALGIFAAGGGTSGFEFRPYTAGGSPVHPAPFMSPVQIVGSDDIDPWFHWTTTGWRGIVHDPGPPPRDDPNPQVFPALIFRTWDAAGEALHDVPLFAIASAPDGQGGSVLLARQWEEGVGPVGPTSLLWIDPEDRVTRSVVLDEPADRALVNWGTGHVLLLRLGEPGRARWLDGAAAALTPWFSVPAAVTAESMHLLVDGTVVVRDGADWNVALRDGAAGTVPVPGWLTARPGTRIATVRGSRAYAVLGSDPARVELVAASGERCGDVGVPAPATSAENRPDRLDVGQDGTLFQRFTFLQSDFGIHCGYQWWTGALH